MAKKGRLRISARFKEIVTILQKAKLSDENFLWKVVRDTGGERREKFPIEISQVDADKAEITLKVGDEVVQGLSHGDEVFFKLFSRNSAFKAMVIRVREKTVVTTFPEEVAVTELRELRRYYFVPADDKIVQLRKVKSNMAEASVRGLNFMVLDVSQGGMALFLPEGQESQLDLKNKIRLEMIGPYVLEDAITGEVVFKMKTAIDDSGATKEGYKVGIQLETRIPPATFERFIIKKIFQSVSDERIVLDRQFREKVHESMGEIRDKLRKNERLNRFFENLNVTRSGGQYLKQHIEMLCDVLCGLARKLGWISERSIDKLIYVAYLHDVRFSQYPKLAQIPNVQAITEQGLYLSDNEHKAFLESPAYSSELAGQDLEAYPDAIKILMQQKELPDGTGFPHGLSAAQLAPLSCLFIVAHYFVDYVIDHEDWSVDDFIKTYSKKFKGQHFTKVFEAMKK